jgi:nicotinamide-nucleotide amidase
VICLPGVPAEMVEMWHDSVAAAIGRFVGEGRRIVRRRRIHCFGAGESRIESMLPDMIRRGRQPTVGITASKATITLRIAAEGATESECLSAMEPTVATIRQCLGTLIFGEEDDELQHAVLRLLRERGKTLATSECATTGLVAEWLASVEDSGDVYRGGLVAAGKTPSGDDDGGGSIARMAVDCRTHFAADLALAVGPMLPSGSKEQVGDVGDVIPTVTFALASASGVEQKVIPCGIHPALRQIYLAKWALNFVRLALLA